MTPIPRTLLLAWLCSALIAALGLSGCGLAPAANHQPPATPPLPTTPAAPPVRVALLYPSSGEMATFGRMLSSGVIMALEEENSRGGWLDRPIAWTGYDSECSYEAGHEAARRAIADGFRLLIGPLCSDAAVGAAVAAQTGGALLIAPTATQPLVTVDGQGQTRPTVFRASYAYPWQGRAAARFARETLGARRAALLADPGDDYAAALAEAFSREWTAQGGQITYRADPPADPADTRTVLAASAASGAEVLYLPAPAAVANEVAGQLQALAAAQGGGLILLGSDSWQTGALDLAATAGSYFTVHFTPDSSEPAVETWAEAYRAAYAVEPTTLAALGYDAAMLLAAGIHRANSLEAAAVAAALEEATVDGVTGPMRFDARHNPLKPVPVLKVEAGRTRLAGIVRP